MQVRQSRILRIRRGSEEETVRQAVESLKNGELIVIPTDTVYGIAADPQVPGAEDRLYTAKGRDLNKPIPLLAAGIAEVEEYGAVFGRTERRLAEKFWPGSLTLVLRVRDQQMEGFRVPDSAIALALLREAGGVLRVTSANRSGESPALTAEEATRSLAGFAGLVLDAGTAPGGVPSTVVRVRGSKENAGNEEIEILRKGAIPEEEIRDWSIR